MIIKSFELNKIDLKKNNFFLFYGENEGFKNQIIENTFKKDYQKKTFFYEESEILDNKNNFFDQILSRSFFENEKLIIISRTTDKITSIIEEILEKKINDLVLILN